GDGPDFQHPGNDDVAQTLPDPLQGVDDQAQVVEGLGQLDRVDLDGREVAEPRQGNTHAATSATAPSSRHGAGAGDPSGTAMSACARSHQNCSRKRMSFSVSTRMSGIPWRTWAQRSMPKPKANPVHSSGSIPTAVKTLGSTIPHPPSSIHPVWQQVRQPSPLHTAQVTSNSAEGSVNGKYDGRNREWMAGPK